MADLIRTLVVDDEPLARENIEILLADDPEIELVGSCANGHDALLAIKRQAPDLMFLDI